VTALGIFQGLPSTEAPRYTRLDEEAEVRRAEARYESWLTGESVGYVAPRPSPARRVPVCLTKRVRIDAEWVRRNRTTDEQQQKITEELRAIYGPDVVVSFSAANGRPA